MLQKFFDLLRDDPVAYVSFLFLFTLTAWFAQVAMYKFLKARLHTKCHKYLSEHGVPIGQVNEDAYKVAREYARRVFCRYIDHHPCREAQDPEQMHILSTWYCSALGEESTPTIDQLGHFIWHARYVGYDLLLIDRKDVDKIPDIIKKSYSLLFLLSSVSLMALAAFFFRGCPPL